MPTHPEIRRVSYAEHLKAATDRVRAADPDRAARLLGAATQLAPLHAIQVSLDALARTAQGYNDGAPDPYGHPLGYHVGDAMKHVAYHRDVLAVGLDAANAMIAEMKSQTSSLETTMSRSQKDDQKDAARGPAPKQGDHPTLTTDGSPHPLEEGGYDANGDPGLPGNISDVEALKEGKQTRAQSEAIAAADAAETEGHTPARADGTDHEEGDDADADPKASKKSRGKAADKDKDKK